MGYGPPSRFGPNHGPIDARPGGLSDIYLVTGEDLKEPPHAKSHATDISALHISPAVTFTRPDSPPLA